jgi:type IV secretion system protein VirB10
MIAAAGGLAAGFILLTSSKPDLRPQPGPELTVRPEIRYEAPPALPVTQVLAPALPDQAPPMLPQNLPLQPAPGPGGAPQRPPGRLLVFNRGGGEGGGSGQARPGASMAPDAGYGTMPAGYQGGETGAGGYGAPGGPPVGQSDSLAARLQPTQLTGVHATVLRNQPYLLTTGTLLPCVLQTAMDSTLPGLVTCVIPQDITGKTGLTLLDRGTRVVGQFQGGLRQGVERMFVVWTRAETPQGVVINLDSPAADPLGRSGMSGEVDRHFWQRFGGALLLSLVDGAMQAGTAAVAKEGTVSLNTGTTSSVVGESLRSSVGIAPTIRKNQGELVSIFVARDLDFSTVYGIAPSPPLYASPVGAPR